jgi:hypothetical protein
MEQRRTTPRARHQTRVFYGDQGLDVAEKIRASGVGRKMFLTTPFIDQAFAQACAVPSPFCPETNPFLVVNECKGDFATAG